MGKKILDSKLLYAVLAIVIAIGLWFYVAAVENPDGDMEISGIPITFLNQEVLAENNLLISEGLDQTATLKVVGPRTSLAKLNQEKDKISLTIDVSRIVAPGDQRMAYTVKLPSGYESSVTVSSRYPSNIDFTVSRRIDKEVPVKAEFDGTLAENYMKDEIRVIPGKIAISGIESEVNKISHAEVVVTGTELTTTLTAETGFVLVDYQGNELPDTEVECSVETVTVIVPVIKTADIPLTVELIAGGGVTDVDKYVTCTIDPEVITVSGAEDDLLPVKEIFLGEINLADITGSDTFEYEIALDPALTNISGITTAKVKVEVHGLETKRMEAENIELLHVPDGFTAESVTKSLAVVVRGTSEALDLVMDQSLRIVADLSDIDAAAGRYTVPVKIYLDGTKDVGVVGSSYKIVVDLVEGVEKAARDTEAES